MIPGDVKIGNWAKAAQIVAHCERESLAALPWELTVKVWNMETIAFDFKELSDDYAFLNFRGSTI